MTTKFRYIGPPALTRGDYGEGVRAVHRLRWTADDDYVPDPAGDMAGVWDSAFGWRIWGSWEAAQEWGIVGEPLD